MGEIRENLVSIIVPFYNSDKFIGRCLDSIVNQRYDNIEIILVDDGSTDQSLSIALDYQKLDNRIRIMTKEHGGLASARNVAIENAKGEFLTFVDSDDYISREYIHFLYTLIKEYDADIAMTHFVKGNEEKYDFCKEYGRISIYSKQQFINKRLIKGDSQSACCKLYKRKIYEKIRFPEDIIWEDLALSAETFYEAEIIVEMETPLYYYYHNEMGIIHSKFDKRKMQALIAYERRLNFLEEKKLDYAYKKFLRQYIVILFQYYYLVKKNLPEESVLLEEIKTKINVAYLNVKESDDALIAIKLIIKIGLLYPYFVGYLFDCII